MILNFSDISIVQINKYRTRRRAANEDTHEIQVTAENDNGDTTTMERKPVKHLRSFDYLW